MQEFIADRYADNLTFRHIALPVKRSDLPYTVGMAIRALRGAVQLQHDDFQEMTEAVVELLTEIMRRNALGFEQLISMIFTSTPDLKCGFPAGAARQLPIGDVALMCASELDIPGALPRVVRVMVHVDTDLARQDLQHVYLRGAEALRVDLAQ